MQTDYSDMPLNTPVEIRTRNAAAQAKNACERNFGNIACVHGHFLPAKYRPLKDSGAIFVTWMRDPLERMVSHYNFWQRTYEPTISPELHRKVVEEQWPLERFAFAEEMRNVYAQFLWSFPLTLFDFVGITENFAEDLSYFSRRFLGYSNKTAPRVNYALLPRAGTAACESFRARFARFHSEDYDLYRAAVRLRETRA